MAYRATQVPEWVSLYQELIDRFPDSREARLAKRIALDQGFHLSHRLGLGGDQAPFDKMAKEDASRVTTVLSRHLLDLRAKGEAVTLEDLAAVADDWETPPVELEVLIAMGEMLADDGQRIEDALTRLKNVLARWPSYVEARHAAAVAYVGLGRRNGDECQAQLRWLLENAPPSDSRRAIWQRLSR